MSGSTAKTVRRLSNRNASKTAQEMVEWAQHTAKAINTLDEAVGLHNRRLDDLGKLARKTDDGLGRLRLAFGIGIVTNLAIGAGLIWAAV
jgi:hypothetical protein